jgi:hypothetical protein
MRRRSVLAAVAAAAATAGCTGLPAGEGGGDGGDDGTTPQPAIAGSSFSIRSVDCATGEADDASVSVEDATVSVSGTVTVADGCHVAELDGAAVENGELRVVVASVAREGVQGCVQCLTEVGYDASVTLSGGRPERVVVVHEARGERREVASVAL